MTKQCDLHGQYESESMEVFGRLIEAKCPACVQAELDRQAAPIIERSEESAKERTEQAWKAMNLEPAYRSVTLDNFEAHTQEQEKAKSTARKVLDGTVLKVLMTGKNGTGKTHLACALVRAFSGRIMTMYEISATIRASYTALATRTELEIVDELATVPLLAIDEIGRTKGSDTEANWLSYIIDKRHVRGLPLVLISNNHVRKDCPDKGCEKCLENFMGEDVMSRLAEGAILVRLTGDDYRRSRRPA